MKNDISKSICKALIFTVLPFAIPLIFEIIPNTFINNAGKIIIVLDVYKRQLLYGKSNKW